MGGGALRPLSARAPRKAGLVPVPVDVDQDGIDVAQGISRAPRARLAIVQPTHQYPTGATMSLARREALVAWCEASGAWILESEIDGDYRFAPHPLPPLYALSKAQRVFYCGSLSKPLAPGLRTNYLVVPRGLMDQFSLTATLVSMLTQLVLARFNAEGHLALHMRRMRKLYARRRSVLLQSLREQTAGYLAVPHVPEGGLRVAATLEPGTDDVHLARQCLAAGIKVDPLSICYAGPGRSGLIIGFASTPEKSIPGAVARLASGAAARTGPIARARSGSTGAAQSLLVSLQLRGIVPAHEEEGGSVKRIPRAECCTVALAVALAIAGMPAGAAQPVQAQEEDLGEVVVTGSRITGSVGMTTPTPVTAVTAEELMALSPSTLISALSQLPQFYGNSNNDVRSGFFGSGGSGNLNLRGLNTGGQSGRTLTLLNGRRVVPGTGIGTVDINILPSALLKRVDTVTGGASAAYGTDAVAGAVNFIVDTEYTGWQLNAQAGTTSRSDHDNMLYSAAWGGDLGERSHLLLSAEYYHADQVLNYGGRDWYEGYSLVPNPVTSNTTPRLLAAANVVPSNATFGGLIAAGVPTTSALFRRYFRSDGTIAPFVLGLGTTTGGHSITNGGSGDDSTLDLATLAPEAQRANAFAYLSFDATPNLKLFVQGLAGQSRIDQPDHAGRFANVAGIDTRITIYRENAFLPAAVRQIMVNENLASFQMNVVGDREGLGRDTRMIQDNKTYSGTTGFQWDITRDGFLQRLAGQRLPAVRQGRQPGLPAGHTAGPHRRGHRRHRRSDQSRAASSAGPRPSIPPSGATACR